MVQTIEDEATDDTNGSEFEAALGGSPNDQKNTPEHGDDTPEIPENQAKPAPVGAPRASLSERQERRITAVNDLHIEKERLQLNYIYKRVPKPYYARWKTEGNELFALAVVLRRRYRENRGKKSPGDGNEGGDKG